MTLTTLHTLSDEPEDTVTSIVAEELAALPVVGQRTDWDELPREFYPLSLRETWRKIVHH